MNAWVDWWQGRCARSWYVADMASKVTESVLDRFGPSIAEWCAAQEALADWQPLRGHLNGHGGAGYWSERAQEVEQAADRFATLLQALCEHHHLPYMLRRDVEGVLTDWTGVRERRYVAHPAAHTLEGTLASGGVM